MASRRTTDGNRIDARARLILTAEALFAEGGIEGVSLREIAAKAGQGNHHAVQYHFASREGLVHEIFEYRMRQMEPARGQLLAAAEAKGALDDARAIVEIIFLPQLDLPGQKGNHTYAKFLCQYLLRNPRNQFGDFGRELPPNLRRTIDLLGKRLDFLPGRVAQRRLLTACFMFLNILSAYEGDDTPAQEDEGFESALDDTLRQIELSLCMPWERN